METTAINNKTILQTAREIAKERPDRTVSCIDIQFAFSGKKKSKYHSYPVTGHKILRVLTQNGFIRVGAGRYRDMGLDNVELQKPNKGLTNDKR